MDDDPIGTVRREEHEGGYSIWQRLHPHATPGNEWMCAWSTAWQNIEATLPHDAACVFPVIGAVPGTPAAAGLPAAPAAPPAISVEVDQEANAAYVKVADGVVFRTAEINNSVNADYDRSAQLLGVEILDLPLAPAAPAARLPTGAASQIATAVHNALCDCMDNHTGISLRSSDWDLVRDAVAALLESWQGASPATRPHVNETSTGGYLSRLPIPAETYRDATAEPREGSDTRTAIGELCNVVCGTFADDSTAYCVGSPGHRIDSSGVGRWHSPLFADFAQQIHASAVARLTAELAAERAQHVEAFNRARDNGAECIRLRAELATIRQAVDVDRDALLDVLTTANDDWNTGCGGEGALMSPGYIQHLADRLIAAGYVSTPGHEWQCPGCGATTRARMADYPTEQDGAAQIVAERHRVVTAKGYDAAHDDHHVHGELLDAARCYFNQGLTYFAEHTNAFGIDAYSMYDQNWPWWSGDQPAGWKPSSSPVRNLVKAGQFIAAEIDRLKRAERGDLS